MGRTDHAVFVARMDMLLKDNGIAKSKMANAIEVHPNTIYRIWSDDSAYPSVPALIKIAREYNISLNWLLGVDNEQE